MVQDREMREAQDFIKSALEDTGAYKVKIGDHIEGIDNIQKKRHLVAERHDGEKFLGIINADPFPSDERFRRKLRSTTNRGIYTLPVFRKTRKRDDKDTFFNWGEGKFRPSLKKFSEGDRKKMIDAKLMERTLEELTDNRVVYFDPDRESLQVYKLEGDIVADYSHTNKVFKESERLVKARIPRKLEDIERFVLGEERTREGLLYAPPVSVEGIKSELEEANNYLERGEKDKAVDKLERAAIKSEELPEELYSDEFMEVYEKVRSDSRTYEPGEQMGFEF